MKKLIVIAAMALSAIGAKAANANDTLVVTTTPIMHCEGCENKIKGNLRFVKGTKKIITSVPDQTVTIIYDARKASPKVYREAFEKIGYEVKPVGGKCAGGCGKCKASSLGGEQKACCKDAADKVQKDCCKKK